MDLRTAILVTLVTVLCPFGAHAEMTSAGEPVIRLSCSDVFDGQGVAQVYIDRIATFAFSEKDNGARLSKWSDGLRIVVRADARPQDFVLGALDDFRVALPRVEGFDAIAQFDSTSHASFKDGDLLVYLTWRRPSEREAAKQRLHALLDEFTPSSGPIETIVGADNNLRLVGIVRSPEGEIRRAVVVADLGYLQLGKQPSLVELLTTAINPNPGNAITFGLPGSSPQEERIYEKVWLSKVHYDLRWTREFRIYLRLVLGHGIAAGLTKEQFTKTATEMLNARSMQMQLANLYGCQL